MGYPTPLYGKTWKKYHTEGLKMVFLHRIGFKIDPKRLRMDPKRLRMDQKRAKNRVLDQKVVIFWSKK